MEFVEGCTMRITERLEGTLLQSMLGLLPGCSLCFKKKQNKKTKTALTGFFRGITGQFCALGTGALGGPSVVAWHLGDQWWQLLVLQSPSW